MNKSLNSFLKILFTQFIFLEMVTIIYIYMILNFFING